MIDIFSAALGLFSGGIIGFIITTLFCAKKLDDLRFENTSLRSFMKAITEELHAEQKKRINLVAKVAIDKPKRDARGRFIPKSKGKK